MTNRTNNELDSKPLIPNFISGFLMRGFIYTYFYFLFYHILLNDLCFTKHYDDLFRAESFPTHNLPPYKNLSLTFGLNSGGRVIGCRLKNENCNLQSGTTYMGGSGCAITDANQIICKNRDLIV